MKHHHHCSCGLKEQIKKFKAGKLGLLGGVLIVGHLLFHVAECLILPTLIVAFSDHSVEAAEDLTADTIAETTFFRTLVTPAPLHQDLFETITAHSPLRR